MLDKNTFGDAPAAIYLAARLNELNNEKLTRKVSSFLDQRFKIINELIDSHIQGTLSLHSLGSLMNRLRVDVESSNMGPMMQLEDERVAQLTRNVLIGRMKQVLRAATSSTRKNVDRLIHINDTINAELLAARSKRRLARLNKPCTYY